MLGNFFGTNASGDNLGNSVGVLINSGSNTIGGTALGYPNVFGFNTSSGLEIDGPNTTANIVLGNFFGTNASSANLGNSNGITIPGSRATRSVGRHQVRCQLASDSSRLTASISTGPCHGQCRDRKSDRHHCDRH